MKRLSLAVLFFCLFVVQGVLAHDVSSGKWGEVSQLPSLLRLSPRQKAAFDAYLKDMRSGMMKAHKFADEQLEKVLTRDQFQQLMNDMKKKMKSHSPKDDNAAKAMISEESTRLLLTANQAAQLEHVALTLHHQAHQLMKNFCTRLQKVLSKDQQKELQSWLCKE